MQNGCRFNVWRLLAVAGAVGAVSGAALANDPVKQTDQKVVKVPVAPQSLGTVPVAPGQVQKGELVAKPLIQQGPSLRGPGPANDTCAGAENLPIPGSVSGDTTTATADPEDVICSPNGCTGQPGVWYTFMGSGNAVTLSTCGSGFDTMLRVYQGGCGGLSCVAYNDDFCGLQSQATFATTAGTQYWVLLRGYCANGVFTLNATESGPPAAGDDCSTAVPLSVPGNVSGDTSGFTSDFGVPFCSAADGSPTIWYAVTGNGNTFIANTCGSGYDTALSVFTGDCGFLSCVVGNDDFCGLQSQVIFSTVAGQTYYIVVGGFGGQSGFYTLDVNELIPPSNDECEGALPLGCNTSITIDNTAAGTNPFDPLYSCHFGAPAQGFGTMWYTFTAGDTSARFTTCSSVFPADDSLLAIYDSCGGFELACNDDFCGFLSRMDVTGLNPGQNYTLQFAAWSPSDQGVYNLDVTCPVPPIPPGDECPTAFVIPELPFSASGDTALYNPDGGLPGCGVGDASNSVWYSMTGTGGIIRASLCNSSYDSGIAVFTGDCGFLTCVANDDDGCGIFAGPSQTTFFSNEGQTYFIVVRGFGTAFGPYALDVTDLGPPGPGDLCSTALPATVPSTVTGDTSTYTPDSGVPACGVIGSSPTVWYMVVGNGNRYRASMCNGTAYDSGINIYTGDCSFLTCVGSDDDGCGIFAGPAQATWDTVDGQVYYVVVGGFGTSAGFYSMDLLDIGPPCELSIPGGAMMENEPDCGLPNDTVNGGCNSIPPVAQTITCGVPVFGSTAWDPNIGFRDTDWYMFDLPQDDTVNITVRSETVTIFGPVGDGLGPVPFTGDFATWCPGISQINPFLIGTDDCTDGTVSVNLTAGTYGIFVSTLFAANPVLCGTRNDYVLTVETGAGCGGTDCNQNGIPDSQEIAANPALDCYNPAVIQNPHVIGGADGALDSCQCQGDFNRNQQVNSTDISAMLTSWLAAVQNGNTNADINCSGSTNSTDISAYLTIWLNQVNNVNPFDGCP